MKTYKGFDKDLKCNGFPFEVGKEYQETDIKLCKKGFHSCKNPLDVLKYYGPAGNRFCEVESDGKIIEATDDTKICAEKIKIETEINLKSIIDLGIKFLFEKIKISKLGYYSHAATSGKYSPAATSGYYSHAATSGKNSIAVAIGKNSKAKSTTGNWIVCSEYDSDGNVKTVKTVKVDGKKIKADTWYTLKNGKFTRVK